MATRKTWFWIIGGICGGGLLLLVAVAGAGIYFISSHVQAETSTPSSAIESFDAVTASFSGRRPLYELDQQERPRLVVELSKLPASSTKPSALMVQAWDPDEQRMVRLALPFWLLRFGPGEVRAGRRENGFDFNEIDFDIDELERIGPALVLDYRNQDGVRVLLWTK